MQKLLRDELKVRNVGNNIISGNKFNGDSLSGIKLYLDSGNNTISDTTNHFLGFNCSIFDSECSSHPKCGDNHIGNKYKTC